MKNPSKGESLSKKRKVLVLIIIVFLSTIMVIGIVFPKGAKFRVQILFHKIIGEIDAKSWSEVFMRMLPSRFHLKSPSLRKKVAIKRFDGEDPNLVLWDTPGGDFWGQSTDGGILKGLFIEQMIWKVYLNDHINISEGDVVLDVGSHLGTFTRESLNRGAKLVVCFECDPIILACFRRTFKQEILEGRVIIIAAAAWDTPGKLRFQTSLSLGGNINEDGLLEVQAVTIDDVVEKLELDQIDFIKMDIEGSERQALKGAQRTLSLFAPKMAISIYHLKNDRYIIPELVLAIQPSYQLRKSFAHAYFFK